MAASAGRGGRMRFTRGGRPDLVAQVLCAVPMLSLLLLWAWWPLGSHRSAPLFFLSVGDFGTASASQKLVASQMAIQASKKSVEFVLSVGDNVYPSGVEHVKDPLFNTVFEDIYTEESLQIPWYMALGDHDHRGSVHAQIQHSKQSAKWNMSGPYYKITVPLGGHHTLDLVVTDSVCLEGIVTTGTPEDRRFFEDYNTTLTGSEAGKEHLRWLEEVLRNSSADWLVVLGHRPVFTCADRPRFPAEQRFSELMHSLFTKYHVDVYMHGHDHVGQHLKKDGVVYIGNGVGGYGNHPAHPNEDTVWFNGDYNGFILHRVTPMELDFTFMAANGSVLHEVRLFQNSASKEKRCSKRS